MNFYILLNQLKMSKNIIIIFFLFMLTSCFRTYYIPRTLNVPLFKEKNEFRAFVAASDVFPKGGGISTTEIQAAYSITNKFAIMANYMSAIGGNKSTFEWGKGTYMDAAFGYYKSIKNHGVFEVFGGVGSSKQYHEYSYGDEGKRGTSELSFIKYFIQPSIGLTHSGVDIAFTSKLSNISFYNIKIDINESDVEEISKNRNSILFEPAITIRGGWKYVKLQMQILVSRNLTNPNLNFEKGGVNFGLSFAFAKRFNEKNMKMKALIID